MGARFGLDDLIYGYYGYYWFIDSTAQFDLLVEPSFNEVNARLIEQQTPLDSTLSSEPLKCIFSTENGMTRVEFNVSAPASTLTYSGAALLTEEVPEISEISPLMPVLIAVGAASVAIVAVVATQVYWKKRKR